ncbi:DNA repair protein RecN [Mangrovimonas aestuarii]|uniref:DNA repair protein RecN n=1 Tax=Mangrovimonas aestuarii TaxID=3018443 RepID=UPI0023785429|nr:DNA repair protein RecN [Mangrovimonas aestuarii]
MLTSLTIKNYALIDELQVNFNGGLSIITGETGAGKSILLGGLSLILGKRADLSSLKDSSTKCIIEAVFDISNYKLQELFEKQELDYDNQTIVRREILPSGKSRAFVNDSPVTLSNLQALSTHLIDIHSQHQTLEIIQDEFQFQVVDALADVETDLVSYSSLLKEYKKLNKELDKLVAFQAEATKEYDYNSFLLNELVEAKLVDGELESLEEEYETLNNIEDIKEKLSGSYKLLNDEQIGVLSTLNSIKHQMQSVAGYSEKYALVSQRVNSSLIELDDVFAELEQLHDELEADPNRLDEVNTKLQLLHNLMKKHMVSSISELLAIKTELEDKVTATENIEDTIKEKEAAVVKLQKEIDAIAKAIHNKRLKVLPDLVSQLETLLSDLGMPNARFNVELLETESYLSNGKDEIAFLFSANKGGRFNVLKKAASGGELSRIMLAIKYILSKYIQLPTIMFDEIDTGVSGEISNKMGDIMKQMSQTMQVFAITHLPQIAAKGHAHFKVYKEDVEDVTQTNLVQLGHDERVAEIAQMLGGVELSNSAIAHAKQLLN